MTGPNTPGDRRLGPVMNEIAGAETAQQLIHYTILTPGEALILVVILVGALMVAGILPTILKLVGIWIGILVLFKILAGVLTLAIALTWGESNTLTGSKNGSGEGNVTSDGSRRCVGTGEVDRAL